MIELPSLDNQKYEEILETAIRKIPSYCPEWTDHNKHDPGITLLELFSWLKEMQQYHLDQITPELKYKYLQLLDSIPTDVIPSKGYVTFNNVMRKTLPKATRLYASDRVFETTKEVALNQVDLKYMYIDNLNQIEDLSKVIDDKKISWYAFGEEPSGGEKLYLGFTQSPFVDGKASLLFDVFDDYYVKRNQFDGSLTYLPRDIVWEYSYANANGELSWERVMVEKDSTYSFSRQGVIDFSIDGSHCITSMEEALEPAYYIRAILSRSGCEESPKIISIKSNFSKVEQKRTLSEYHDFTLTKENRDVSINTYLAIYGCVYLQAQKSNGKWVFIDGNDVRCEKDDDNNSLKISILNDELFYKENINIRVICFENEFEREMVLGSISGLPFQRISYEEIGMIVPNSFKLLITGDGEAYEEWERTTDFWLCNAKDKKFYIAQDEKAIYFGDNENGMLPERGIDNILIISCQISEGQRGNVKAGEINRILLEDVDSKLGVYNHKDTYNGKDAESIEQAAQRHRLSLLEPQRGVTAEDYERLAMYTPGLRVSKVKAIPMFKKGLVGYPEVISEADISLVVMPYSKKRFSKPDDNFLSAVQRYIEPRRMITSRVHLLEPEFIELSVDCELIRTDESVENSEVIIDYLNRYFSPQRISRDEYGWEFGKPVRINDVITYLNQLKTVKYVKRVVLNARGNGYKKTLSGDILIPPYAMVYPGRININTVYI